MPENKTKSKISEAKARWYARFFSRFLVFRTWAGLTFFVFSFAFFTFILRLGGDLGRITIVAYGGILILLSLMLIGEYVFKTIRLQRLEVVRSYSAIVSLNTLFGLILPLIYFNVILAVVIRALSQMTYYGTFWCQARLSIVSFYYNIEFYAQMNTLIFWLIIFTAILFLFGGLVERLFRR